MSTIPPSRLAHVLLACLAVPLPGLFGQDTPNKIERAATQGKNRIIIVAPHGKPVGVKPDLLFYKDGRIIEAWELEVRGTAVRYTYFDEKENRFERQDKKHNLLTIQFGRTLEDFLADEQRPEPTTPKVAPARLQPVRKREILAGTFEARQGRFTRWTATFTSQLHKYFPHSRSATEYGNFVIKSHMRQPVSPETLHDSEVIAKGQYFLYAPGVFGNDDWVLNLTQVAYTEHDESPRTSVYTERLRDEVFIVDLSKDGNVFNLSWANQEGWQWTSPTQQTFYRNRDLEAGVSKKARYPFPPQFNPPRRGTRRPGAEPVRRPTADRLGKVALRSP